MHRTRTFLGVGVSVMVLISLCVFGTAFVPDPLMEWELAAEDIDGGAAVPDLGDRTAWQCEDVTAEAHEDSPCGVVHVCRSRRDANVMAQQISLRWNKVPVYRIWGPAGKTHQSLQILESKVWLPPLPGGKMECGPVRDAIGYHGIVFMIYHEDDPDFWAAWSFYRDERSLAPAASARPLRRTNF